MIKHAIIDQLNKIRQLLEAPQPSQTRLLAAVTHTSDLAKYEIIARLDFCISHLFSESLTDDDLDAISGYLSEIEELLEQ